LHIHNRNLFRNLGDYKFVIYIKKFGKTLFEESFFINGEGLCKLDYSLNIKEKVKSLLDIYSDELIVGVKVIFNIETLYNLGEVSFSEVAVRENMQIFDALLKAPGNKLICDTPLLEKRPYKLIMGVSNFGVKGENFEVLFSQNFFGERLQTTTTATTCLSDMPSIRRLHFMLPQECLIPSVHIGGLSYLL